MTKTLQELHMMAAKLWGLIGGLDDLYDSDRKQGQEAMLPLIETCHRLSRELDLAIQELEFSHVLVDKASSTEAPEQKETLRSKHDFDEINRLTQGLSEIASLCASLDIVNWELCQQAFKSREQQKIRDAIINLVKVICEKAEATLDPSKDQAA